MAIINLIGALPADRDHAANTAALQDLAVALAETAPRDCSVRYLVPRDVAAPEFDNPLVSVEQFTLAENALGLLWQSGALARTLDGELLHSLTPLAPIRARKQADGSQATVTVPHLEVFSENAADANSVAGGTRLSVRAQRRYYKRALQLAQQVVVPTYELAQQLQADFGFTGAQVVPLAAPNVFLAGGDAAERRAALRLPDAAYFVTFLHTQAELRELLPVITELAPAHPPLLVITSAPLEIPAEYAGELDERVLLVHPREVADVGAILEQATLLLVPQGATTMNFEVYAALAAGVPLVCNAANSQVTELMLDAGETFESFAELPGLLGGILDDAEKRERLSLLAHDRATGFSWENTARTLWHLHASL
ncbi:MAG: mannosyltransferase [Microbacteriaceae bacterium]|nr:mannosyltransferase [Microbacteriaceae bacterium]